MKWAILVGVLAVAGAVSGVLIAVLGGGDKAKTRPLKASLTTALLNRTSTAVTFAGTVRQSPGGHGVVEGMLTLHGDLRKAEPVPLTGKLVFRFDGGRIDTTLRGEAIPQPDRTVDLLGKGTVDGGTGEFEGATGSFAFKSGQEPKNPTVGHPRINGTITY